MSRKLGEGPSGRIGEQGRREGGRGGGVDLLFKQRRLH